MMAVPCWIVGIMLVRDEDRFVERALRNAIRFCDEFLVCDHGSRDGTAAVLARLEREFSDKLRVRRIAESRESHLVLREFMGRSGTWVFAVDGDEIYDPEGLARLRGRMETGELDEWWVVFGNVLNVVELDEVEGRASGYLAPPCRSMTKLYNFAAITGWEGRDIVERLHGGRIEFREGFDAGRRLALHEDVTWEEADFRCLHCCFLRRSSSDGEGAGVRRNIMDRHVRSLRKVWASVRERLGGAPAVDWKQDKYRRGDQETRDVRGFFPK